MRRYSGLKMFEKYANWRKKHWNPAKILPGCHHCRSVTAGPVKQRATEQGWQWQIASGQPAGQSTCHAALNERG